MTPSGVGPATFRLVAQSINKLRRKCFIISVRLAVRDQVSASKVFGGFSWNSAYESFAAKRCIEQSSQHCSHILLKNVNRLPIRNFRTSRQTEVKFGTEGLHVMCRRAVGEFREKSATRKDTRYFGASVHFCPLFSTPLSDLDRTGTKPMSTTLCCGHFVAFLKRNDKAVPLQAWIGPEGSRKLRFPDFMTTAQDGGKVVSLTQRPPLPPGNTPGTHFC